MSLAPRITFFICYSSFTMRYVLIKITRFYENELTCCGMTDVYVMIAYTNDKMFLMGLYKGIT